MTTTKRAAFFDRDGVIIKTNVINGKPYAIRNQDAFELMPGALEVLTSFKEAGYMNIIVTNQPDVGNGIVERAFVDEVNNLLRRLLPIHSIEVCYHKQTDGCDCRKPKIGMFRRAEKSFNLCLNQSIMVGDRPSDIVAGHRAGCFTMFIESGYNETLTIQPDIKVNELTQVKPELCHRQLGQQEGIL